jgi:hypothetical protein
MSKIVELKIEETKAVAGGIKVSAPPVVGVKPPPLIATATMSAFPSF